MPTRPMRWTRHCRRCVRWPQQRGGKLWCVFGCGGDRDPIKRPLMAAVAEKNADRVVVTSDNPRSEKPERHHQPDPAGPVAPGMRARCRPIARWPSPRPSAWPAPQDVVLLAGKGHEDYQEIAGVKLPFSDQAHAQAALDARSAQ